tara:strand:+ start:251 stop:1504 length:1254 start_codon:yes stop_codon:yes gene_type:complete
MNKFNHVVIVGGGTSGWLSAIYFISKDIKVTLIESKNILPIGVGEGSWPNIHKLLHLIDISPEDINSTKKVGINYIDWYSNHSSKYNNWYHPFTNSAEKPPFSLGFDAIYKFYNEINIYPDRSLHAIHFEVDKFIPILKNKCMDKGINYIQDNVMDCELDNNGFIDSVILSDGKKIKGKLFVDCTGFKRKLISKMNPTYIDASEYIPVNKAITTHIDNPNKGDMYWTKAIALSSGWSWEIPLQDKTGVGYVYSDKFISDEDAVKEFNNYLGINKEEYKVLKWNPGFLKKNYINNCLSIGLSSGFLEPLEASSIGITVRQLTRFDKMFESKWSINQYNSEINWYFKQQRDYILAHYILNKRDDSMFWNYVRKIPISDELLFLFDRYKYYLEDCNLRFNLTQNHAAASWEHLLYGMNFD